LAGQRITIALHPLCPSSHKLVLDLDKMNILDKVEIVILDKPRPLGKAFPWSVPLVISPEGEPLAMDPIEAEEIKTIIENGSLKLGDERKMFSSSILYSAYASSIALAHRSLEPLLGDSFLRPALRLDLRNRSPQEARQQLQSVINDIYMGERERIARSLSVSIVRYLWYNGATLEDLKSVDTHTVGAVILGMASIGRSFLPVVPKRPDMAEFIAGFIKRRARGLLAKIEREYHEILGDNRYQELLGRKLH